MSPSAIRLPLSFDAAKMQADLAATRSFARVPQFGPYHRGEWAGISLWSEGGDVGTTRTGRVPSGQRFAPTEALERAPYLREVLFGLPCPKRSVRLLDLPPGGRIEPHVDAPLTFQHGIARLHVPVVTHPDVVFVIGGERCRWKEGELWWGDFSREHWVFNEGPVTRTHLVIDVEIDDFILSLFPAEFLRGAEARGIARYRAPLAASEAELRAFEIDLEVPAGVVPIPSLERGGEASVRVAHGELRLEVAGRGVLNLEPVGPGSLRVVGWASGITLERRAGGVAFVARGLPGRIAEQASADNPVVARRETLLPIRKA